MATTTEPVEQPAQVRPRRGFGVARWILRVLILITAVLLALQPVSIGEYLSGRYNMLGMHSAVATGAMAAAFFLVLAAIGYTLLGGRVWVMVASIALLFAVVLQLGMGYSRTLAVHIPLGVAIVGGAIVLAVFCCTPAFSRFRTPRAERPAGKEGDR